jgi:hypothetical protein
MYGQYTFIVFTATELYDHYFDLAKYVHLSSHLSTSVPTHTHTHTSFVLAICLYYVTMHLGILYTVLSI